jgi:hypothetical protein
LIGEKPRLDINRLGEKRSYTDDTRTLFGSNTFSVERTISKRSHPYSLEGSYDPLDAAI